MKKISKVATASVLLFTLANPLAVFAENRVDNVSEASSNKTTQDLTISSEEINGDIVFYVTAVRDTYEAILYAKINGKNYTYNLGNLKKGQVSKIVQPGASINNNSASITKESKKEKSLPNTSVVRELVEKSISYSNELSGNIIEAKVVYKAYELVEKNPTLNEGTKYVPESKVKEGAIVKPEVLVKPEYKEVLGGAIVEPAAPTPKAEEPATPAPKAEEPSAPAPKVEEPAAPAPKAEKPAVPAPKVEEPAVPAPKVEEPAAPAPKVEEPATPAPKVEEPAASAPKAEEPVAPAPKVEEPAAPASKEEEPAASALKAEELAAPKEEEPVAPAPKAEEPAAPAPKAEEPAAPAPKEEEPAAPAPKVEEPVTPAPKVEEPSAPAPKVEEPATPAPKVEEPAASAPKAEEPVAPAPKVEEPAAPASKEEEPAASALKAEELAAPKEEEPVAPAPKAEEPAAPAPKAEEPAAPAPKEEEPAAPAPKAEEPAASAPKAEEPAAPAPKEEEPATPTPKAEEPAPAPKAEEPAAPKEEEPAAPAPKAEEPVAPAPKVEEPAAPAPKVEEPAAPMPKAEEPAASSPKAEEPAEIPKESTSSEDVEPRDEKLEEAKKDGQEIIKKIAASKLSEIEKVKDEAEKAKLEAKLKELKEAGLEAINNAKNHDAAVDATDEYQTKIDEINVPGEELPAPNYDKDNLTNGRNEGTTIEGGSTAIGHGSGEASPGVTQPESSATASTGAASQLKATSASTGAATQPEAVTESPAPTQPATAPTAKTQPVETSETATSGTSSFRNAPEVQIRARRVARAANQPDGTVNISYNYDGMPDINGFLSNPGENNTVAIPNSATEDEVKELVKAKIQAKAQELAKHGYKVKEEIVFEQDTIVKNFNYVVTFTKEKTGTTGFRIAPEVQVRAKKVVKRDLSNKTKQINIYYNLTNLKDIAGALGEVGENNMLTLSGNATKEEIKKAIEEHTKSQIEKLNKQGFKVVSTTDLDQIVEGGDSYDYVVEFTKESKSTSANNTGFRKAPLIQKRAKRSVEQKETVDVNVYFNLKTLPGIAGALDVDGDNTIKLPKDASKEQVKEAIKDKIAKVEKRGYKVSDFYFGAKTERGYDYVVEFTKESKSTSANNTGFRKAPLVQKRAKRSAEVQETVDANIYFNLKTLPGIAGALDVDGDTTIKLPKNATIEQVKATIQTKIAKVEKRGYKVTDAYFGAKTEHGYDFVVEFNK